MRVLFLVVGVISLILVVTGLQSLAEENVICVCVKKNGQMLLSESGQCKPQQSLVCWNVEGPQGEPGEPGPAGTPCWDLNGNHDCDLATEDKNSDGICDVLDCQGPSGIGAIKVSDSSEPPQYLGILLSAGKVGLVEIFIPGLNRATFIDQETGNIPLYNDYFYESDTCTGMPLLPDNDIIYRGCDDGKFYVGIAPMIWLSEGSRLEKRDCTDCEELTGSASFGVFRTEEIPENTFPFILPVTLPLIYEYQDD